MKDIIPISVHYTVALYYSTEVESCTRLIPTNHHVYTGNIPQKREVDLLSHYEIPVCVFFLGHVPHLIHGIMKV